MCNLVFLSFSMSLSLQVFAQILCATNCYTFVYI